MRPTNAIGCEGEERAARALRAAGYAIVERNFRCRAGEIDLVARDGPVLVFVEVRSRADGEHGDASWAVSRPKQRQVARVAAVYLALRAPDADEIRFDVVAITGDALEILRDAFRA